MPSGKWFFRCSEALGTDFTFRIQSFSISTVCLWRAPMLIDMFSTCAHITLGRLARGWPNALRLYTASVQRLAALTAFSSKLRMHSHGIVFPHVLDFSMLHRFCIACGFARIQFKFTGSRCTSDAYVSPSFALCREKLTTALSSQFKHTSVSSHMSTPCRAGSDFARFLPHACLVLPKYLSMQALLSCGQQVKTITLNLVACLVMGRCLLSPSSCDWLAP